MSFRSRHLDLTFTLGEGSFGESGQTTVKVSGLRASARIVKAGGPSMGTAQISVFGLKLSLMNQLSTLGMTPTLVRRNTVTVEAGERDEGSSGPLTTVFVGTITNAFGDFRAAPNVPFIVHAHTGLLESVKTAEVTSYNGSVQVASIMASLASKMGLSFENNGVTGVLQSPYLSGSYRTQAMAVAKAGRVEWIIDNGKMAIWPTGQARRAQVPKISKNTGMELYPTFTSKGIGFRTLFNQSIGYGGEVEVESDLTPACGRWIVYMLGHELEAQTPGGKWHSDVEAARPGLVVVQ